MALLIVNGHQETRFGAIAIAIGTSTLPRSSMGDVPAFRDAALKAAVDAVASTDSPAVRVHDGTHLR
jgi:hypothetical protein